MKKFTNDELGVVISGDFLESVSFDRLESLKRYYAEFNIKPQTLFKGMSTAEVKAVTGDRNYHYGVLNKKVFESLLM